MTASQHVYSRWVVIEAYNGNCALLTEFLFLVLRLVAARCYPRVGMATQDHGLCDALLDPGKDMGVKCV